LKKSRKKAAKIVKINETIPKIKFLFENHFPL